MSIAFTVYGVPAPQGSKRHVGHGIMVESSKKVAPWREDVKLAALRAVDLSPDWDRSAAHLRLTVVFWLTRPRSHFRTGRNAHLLRDRAPAWPGTKPDLDKLLRSTGDALTTAGIYADDCRVVRIVAEKAYAVDGRPGADIVLIDLDDEPS